MDEIGGKDAKSLYETLIEMKDRSETKNIMDLHARGYTDAQLRALAEFISQLPKTEQDHDENR
jgi:cytochrome c553